MQVDGEGYGADEPARIRAKDRICGAWRDRAGRSYPVRPAEHFRGEFARNADEVRDDGDRYGRGELFDEVGGPLGLKRVDPLVRQLGDAGRELLDLARNEGAVDESPEPGVLGRLQFEKRMALERVERGEMGFGFRPAELLAAHHMEDLPAEAFVAQQGRNVGMGGEAPETVILPEEDGRFGADRGVEGRIARIEADAAALGRR